MITFLKTWSNQIIVATIIAIILEMILPEGNNKKYIKMIIGIYVLFTIISPAITKVTGNSLEFDFDYSQYFDDIIEISSNENEFDESNSKLIKQAYIDNIENDIKSKIKQKGYEVTSLKISIIEDKKSEKYGTITNMILKLDEITEESQNEESSNNINIEEVEVKVANNKIGKEDETQKTSKISDKDIIAIKAYLSNEYSIEEKFIIINQ